MTASPVPESVSAPRLAASRRLLAACLVVIFVASWLASLVQTSFGHVRVTEIRLPTQNGQWIVADLFRPLTATAETPAPLVVVVPGFQRAKETQANISLELARRGMVVIALDPYSQGSSSSSTNPRSATNEGYGMFAVVNYAAETDNLNYIDKTRIGVTGHSAGGNAAIQAASYFGAESLKSKTPSKVHSVFVSGYVLTFTEKILRPVRSNVGISYALHNPPVLHPFQPYSPADVADQIAYFQNVFGLGKSVPPADQVWPWKEIFSLAALVAAFVSLVPLAHLLLAHVSFFHGLIHPVSPAPAAPSGRGRIIFWTFFLTGALIACFSYIPFCELSQKLFTEASGREQTWFFPQRMNNAVVLWAFCNGLIGFTLFYLGYRLHGRAAGASPAAWGVATTPRELFRTAVLAAVLWSAFFLTLFVVYAVFHVDYRFLFLGARVFQPALLILVPMYAPFFFVFFLSNSLRVNAGMRFANQPEWRSLLLAGLGNSLGLIFILAAQYLTFALTGTVRWTESWLYVNLLFALVPMMFILPYFNRAFFRLTGRIYLGPLTTCLVFIMILLSNTVCYLPL